MGLVYDEARRVRLDPDQQVQQAIRLLFETFRRTGAAHATVIHFRKERLQFPRRLRSGTRKGELVWGDLSLSRVLQVLHNPRYAGAFSFGRSRTRIWPDGSYRTQPLPREEWLVLIPNHHEGYISWEEYEDNQRRLQETAQAYGKDRRKSPPREGPALLQGLVICGVCGRRMTVRYHARHGDLYPDYVCTKSTSTMATPMPAYARTVHRCGHGRLASEHPDPHEPGGGPGCAAGNRGASGGSRRHCAPSRWRARSMKRTWRGSATGGRSEQSLGGRYAGSGMERGFAKASGGTARLRALWTERWYAHR